MRVGKIPPMNKVYTYSIDSWKGKKCPQQLKYRNSMTVLKLERAACGGYSQRG